jgi:hypothetical protein
MLSASRYRNLMLAVVACSFVGAAASAQSIAPRLTTSLQSASKNDSSTPGQPSARGRGGPDAFGYTWVDSAEPDGPTFVWNDISGTGTAVTLSDDSSVDVPFPGGFTFSFYGAVQSSVRIGSNGFIAFGGSANTFTNAPIPTAADPNNMIAGYWDDLNPSDGGTIHWQYNAGAGTFTVQYTNVPRFSDPTSTMTFQIVLHANGNIVTYYNAMVGVIDSGTIGIENGTGTVGLQVVFNAPYVANNLAIRFASLPLPVAQVSPTSLTFNMNPDQSSSQNVTISNTAAAGANNLNFTASMLGNEASSVTHSATMNVVAGAGVACGPGLADNFLYRVFDLSALGVTETFEVTSVDMGIETAGVGPSTVTLYTLNGPFVVANLTQVAQASLPLNGQSLVVVNVPISATFQPTDIMVVEWAYDQIQPASYFGGNSDGQTGPTYVRSTTCGVPEPTDLATIGFPSSHWAMTVNANAGPPVTTVAPGSGSVAPQGSMTVAVTANTAGLTTGTYNYQLEIETNDPNNATILVPVTVNVSGVGIEDGPTAAVRLEQNSPNPVSSATDITYSIAEAGAVRLEVFDLAGRHVATLVDAQRPAGTHTATWDARGVANGVYMYQLQAAGTTETRRLVIAR